jgi:hypothetical protein
MSSVVSVSLNLLSDKCFFISSFQKLKFCITVMWVNTQGDLWEICKSFGLCIRRLSKITLWDILIYTDLVLFFGRKFADIGHTVSLQYSQGIHKISSWADLVTVHPIPGEGVITGLKSAVTNLHRGCFLVVEMSSAGNLASPNYVACKLCSCLLYKGFCQVN